LTSLPVSLRHGAGFPGWIVGAIVVAIGTAVAIDPMLVGNYTGVAIAMIISGVLFYVLFRKRDEIEEMENQIGKERRYENEETLTHEEPVSEKKRQDGA